MWHFNLAPIQKWSKNNYLSCFAAFYHYNIKVFRIIANWGIKTYISKGLHLWVFKSFYPCNSFFRLLFQFFWGSQHIKQLRPMLPWLKWKCQMSVEECIPPLYIPLPLFWLLKEFSRTSGCQGAQVIIHWTSKTKKKRIYREF